MEDLHANYTRNNPCGFVLTEDARQQFMQAIDSISVENGRPVYIGDYGAADGGTAMPIIEDGIRALKKEYGEDQSVVVIYEDLVSVDFNAIFRRMQGIHPKSDEPLSSQKNVFVLANATSMYSLCMPPGTMDIIYTCMATHYLTEKPCQLTESLTSVTCNIEDELEAYRRQAESDWETFLLLRAQELRTGGYLLVVSHEGKRRYPIYILMDKAWKRLLTKSRISKEEYVNASLTFYHRSLDEYMKPFQDTNSKVRRAGLRVTNVHTKDVPKPDYSDLADRTSILDVAEGYLLDSRRWTEKALRSALSRGRTEECIDLLLDEFYNDVANTILKDPVKYTENNSFAFFLIQKVH